MPDALYERDGSRFVPTELAAGPWAPGTQHGGAVTALLARAVETRSGAEGLLPARLCVDLFRSIPMKPLQVEVRTLRDGRRIRVLEATLLAESTPVARATALLLLRSEQPNIAPEGMDPNPPPGPEGLETSGLVPAHLIDRFPKGFHTNVEVRWATRPGDSRPAAWLRMPMGLIADEKITHFQRAAALSDLANAMASIARRHGHAEPPHFVNADNSLYLTRLPTSEWICLQTHLIEEHDGIGIAAAVLYDERGRAGRSLSARLADAIRRED